MKTRPYNFNPKTAKRGWYYWEQRGSHEEQHIACWFITSDPNYKPKAFEYWVENPKSRFKKYNNEK
jgi:hypothetical protein